MTQARIRAHHPYYADDLGLEDYSHVLRGVYVGGCVDERVSWSVWEGKRSHAHSFSTHEWVGWICILSPADVLTPSGLHSQTLLHELAHLLAPNGYHTRSWKRWVTKLGAGQEIERAGLKPL